jgi:hypothetical protein
MLRKDGAALLQVFVRRSLYPSNSPEQPTLTRSLHREGFDVTHLAELTFIGQEAYDRQQACAAPITK